jgi:putative ABC transport system permease protein
MIKIALRDLQWRTRRIVIPVIGAALVLALAIVVSGLSAAFENESARTVALARASSWVIDEGGTGPFLQPSPLPAATVDAIVAQVGEEHAAPLVFGRQSVRRSDDSVFEKNQHVNMVGAAPGRLGSPLVVSGTGLQGYGEAVVDRSLGADVGESIKLGNQSFRVVGQVSGARLLAGVPNVYITLRDAQVLAFGGRNLATTVVVDRDVTPPAGTKSVDNAEAVTDGLRPVVNAQKTIGLVRSLLWLVAALIVGSVMYLSVLERTKDVAVLKGMGARNTSLVGSLAAQAAILCGVASAIAAVLAVLIAPFFPMPSEIPVSAFLLLPVVALVIGQIASLTAARRIISIQPALAFGS